MFSVHSNIFYYWNSKIPLWDHIPLYLFCFKFNAWITNYNVILLINHKDLCTSFKYFIKVLFKKSYTERRVYSVLFVFHCTEMVEYFLNFLFNYHCIFFISSLRITEWKDHRIFPSTNWYVFSLSGRIGTIFFLCYIVSVWTKN